MINFSKLGLLLAVVYFLVINIAGIAVCGIDKRKAVRRQWRIPEKDILMIAVLGGSPGVLIGMYGFRHKTKHLLFTIGVPMILLCQILLVAVFVIR